MVGYFKDYMTTGLLDYRKGRGEGIHTLGNHSRLRDVLDYFPPGMCPPMPVRPLPNPFSKINAN